MPNHDLVAWQDEREEANIIVPEFQMLPQPAVLNGDTIRKMERDSIRAFVEANRRYLRGRVLDFGAGKPGTCREPQPYRDLVDGEYEPYDLGDNWPRGQFDAVLCTQVLQYCNFPRESLRWLVEFLKPGGWLVLTYQTNWDEVEASDLFRITFAGMRVMLNANGIYPIIHQRRAEVNLNGFRFPLGYGVVAQR